MKQLTKLLLIMSIGIILFGCNDNIFSSLDDDSSAEAKADAIGFAFIEGDYAKVVNLLDQKQRNQWSGDDAYKYVSSKLGTSGVNITNVFDNLYNKNNTAATDPYSMVQKIMGISTVDTATITKLSTIYKDVMSVCNMNLNNNQNMVTVCGIAGAANTTIDSANIMLKVTGVTSIPDFTEAGIKQFIASNSIDETAILNQFNSDPTFRDEVVQSLTSNMGMVTNAVTTLYTAVPDAGDFTFQLAGMVNQVTDTNGQVSDISIANYISSVLGGL